MIVIGDDAVWNGILRNAQPPVSVFKFHPRQLRVNVVNQIRHPLSASPFLMRLRRKGVAVDKNM